MAKLNVNNKVVEVDVEGSTPLLWVLREQLELTGTKYGCGIAQCGACTVHIDGVAQRSCILSVDAVGEDEEITTIEGLSENADHPVQLAWAELDVPQCGFCQSGLAGPKLWKATKIRTNRKHVTTRPLFVCGR